MDAEKPTPKEPSSSMTHSPLPYVVRVRTATDDDSAPRVTDYHVLAYSLIEAAMQAIMEAGGTGLDGDKQKVEHIGPDMAEYDRLFGVSVFSAFGALAGNRKPSRCW